MTFTIDTNDQRRRLRSGGGPVFEGTAQSVCDQVEVSPMGTVIGYLKGDLPGKRAVITAHADEIGFMVKNITEDGFILFEKVGDYSNKVIPARKVWIQTEKGRVPGVIGLRARLTL